MTPSGACLDSGPGARTEPAAGWQGAPLGVAARAMLIVIASYRAISAGRAPRCRFVPSCSEYAADAVRTLGARRSIPLIARRLGRCRPRGGYGYDPVPRASSAAPVGNRGLVS